MGQAGEQAGMEKGTAEDTAHRVAKQPGPCPLAAAAAAAGTSGSLWWPSVTGLSQSSKSQESMST